MTVAGKVNSGQVRINQISNSIDELRRSIDDQRIDETHFDIQLKVNRHKLKQKETEILEYTNQSDIVKHKVNTMLAGFSRMGLAKPAGDS